MRRLSSWMGVGSRGNGEKRLCGRVYDTAYLYNEDCICMAGAYLLGRHSVVR